MSGGKYLLLSFSESFLFYAKQHTFASYKILEKFYVIYKTSISEM